MLNRTLCPVFRALGNPTRRWFVECLRDGAAGVSELEGIFPITLPTVMHHLRVLEKCGLVCSEKQRAMRIYSLRPEGFEEAEKWLRWIAASLSPSRPHAQPHGTLAEYRQLAAAARSISTTDESESSGAEQVLPRQT